MTDVGYLLSYVRYGDYDVIVHCFTQKMGFQSYFLRGIYSAKNKKKAYLAPLNEITFVTDEYCKSNIVNIKKIEQCKSLCSNDIRISSMIFFVAEFLSQVLKTEVKQENIYHAIKEFCNAVEREDFYAHFIFLIKFLKIQGVAPLVNESKYLEPETGSFEIMESHHLFNEEISSLWKNYILESGISNIKMKNELKRQFLDSVMLYCHYHFPDFKTPKSLEVLKMIFTE